MSSHRKKYADMKSGFGVKYGVRSRKRYSEIKSRWKEKHLCPQCNSNSVRRKSVGIWNCTKCGFKFTGGAYVPLTKVGTTSLRSAKDSTALAKGL